MRACLLAFTSSSRLPDLFSFTRALIRLYTGISTPFPLKDKRVVTVELRTMAASNAFPPSSPTKLFPRWRFWIRRPRLQRRSPERLRFCNAVLFSRACAISLAPSSPMELPHKKSVVNAVLRLSARAIAVTSNGITSKINRRQSRIRFESMSDSLSAFISNVNKVEI